MRYFIELNDRWVINPVAYVGISNEYRSHIIDAGEPSYFFIGKEMVIRVALQVGYRL